MRMFTAISLLFLSCICNAQIITTIAGTDSIGYKGDGGPGLNAEFNYAANIAIDKSGDLYISDQNNNVIRKINKSGIITTVVGNGYGAGAGIGGYRGDGGPALSAELYIPIGITFDRKGNLYIADGGNSVVRKVDALGIITTIAGNGKRSYSGDGGKAIDAGLFPYGIAVDSFGNIFIADDLNVRIRKIDTTGIITTVAGGGTNLGSGILATDAEFRYPGIIAISPSNELYIPDWTHHRVCKVDAAGILTVVAGNGKPGNNGDGGLAIDAELTAPNTVAFDKDGNMYISDNKANVVRKVNKSGIITTVAGNGSQGYNGDGGLAIDAELNEPNNAMTDSEGNLYIPDINNNVIRKVAYTAAVNNQTVKIVYSISPNPATNRITIKTNQQIANLQITNTIGQLIYTHTYNNTQSIQLNIKDWPSGIYFLRINNAYVQKLIKE